jgi:hypothetical protein
MIHFASLFCVDYDMDLMVPWTLHYLGMNLDSYTIFLHSPSGDNAAMRQAEAWFKLKGMRPLVTIGPFNDGELRRGVLKPLAESLDKNDLLVTADSDEFQQTDGFLYGKYDMTVGTMIDCYDKTLHDVGKIPGENGFIPALPEQYPLRDNVQELIIKTLPGAAQRFWPRVNRNKICCAKACLPVAYGGSHALYPDDNGILPQVNTSPGIEIHHYCWRGSMLRRMAGKHYYDAASMWYTWKFFGGVEGSEPPELLDAIRGYEELQKQKGWEPARA